MTEPSEHQRQQLLTIIEAAERAGRSEEEIATIVDECLEDEKAA